MGTVIQFKTRLPPIIREQLYELVAKLNNVILREDNDKAVWRWTTNKRSTMRSHQRA
jgi:hypothetical protein